MPRPGAKRWALPGWSCRGLLLALLLLSGEARSEPAQTLDQVVLRAVRGDYAELHACYRQALAEDRSRGGTLFVRLTLGFRDTVRKAALERDELGHKGVAACVLQRVERWTLEGAARAGAKSGSEIVIPITFKAMPEQFAVNLADLRLQRLGPGRRGATLLSAKNAGARRATLELWQVSGEAPLAPGGEAALYLMEGEVRLVPGKAKPAARKGAMTLRPGCAVWLPAGRGALLQGKATLVALRLPPTRAGSRGKTAAPKPVCARRVRPRRLANGAVTVVPLLHRKTLGHGRFYLGTIAARRGFALVRHGHSGAAEVVLLLGGAGTVTQGQTEARLAEGHAAYLAGDQQHALTVEAAMKALQIYLPAGPEQRYFRAGPGSGKGRKPAKGAR